MRLLAFLGFMIPFLSGTTAFAQAYVSSQFEHQTNKGVFELTPLVGAGSVQYKSHADERTSNTSVTDQSFNLGLTGEYGISESLSIGLALGYEKENFSFSPAGTAKGDGMIDPQLYFNGRANLGGGILRYGANLRVSASKATIAYPSSGGGDTAINEYNGGLTFTPNLGYEFNIGGPNTLGVRLTYDLIQTDRSVTETNSSGATNVAKIKGGNEMTAVVFYEMNVKPMLWGVDVGLRNYNTTQIDPGDGSGLTKNNNNYTAPKADVYMAYSLADNLTLIPQIGYDTPNTGSQVGRLQSLNTNNSGGLYGDVALRIAF